MNRRKLLEALLASSTDNVDIDGEWVFNEHLNFSAEQTCFILKTSKNCSIENEAATINVGGTYITEIIPNEGKDINSLQLTVIYNDEDIAEECYDAETHMITIANVQYNIEIIAVIQGVPKEYEQYDYLEGTGTQYINTQIVSSTSVRTIIEFKYMKRSSYGRVFGTSGQGGSQYGCRADRDSMADGSAFHFELPNSAGCDFGSIFLNNFYRIDFNNDGNIYINDTLNYIETTPPTVGFQNIWIFGHNGSSLSCIRVYRCQLYNNNILIRDFIPCVRKSDSKPGLYDIINDVFYTNAGTGEFIYGND